MLIYPIIYVASKNSISWKHFSKRVSLRKYFFKMKDMLIRNQHTSLLQIVCYFMLSLNKIFLKSIIYNISVYNTAIICSCDCPYCEEYVM